MHSRHLLAASAFIFLLPGCAARAAGPVVWLDTLNLSNIVQDFGNAQAKESMDGHPITLGARVYAHGVGTHANSAFSIPLGGEAERFEATVGVDDETKGRGSLKFTVLVDGKVAAQTGVLRGGDAPQRLSVPLAGAKSLALLVGEGSNGPDFDHGDWADAAITLADGATALPPIQTRARTLDAEPRLRPVPVSDVPAIHGARVVGETPGRPFLFLIPATGAGPLRYGATGLPAGLSLDPNTGIITGALRSAGTTRVMLFVRGPQGVARRPLSIVGGARKLAMTPPMGWNSWNVWGTSVDDAKVRAAADVMVSSGLAGHGFRYVNIDDGWEAGRDGQGVIQTNAKFPDLKATSDYVHSRGLKFGIYSSPGPQTCGGYTGSYQHERQDARSYADWGVDYLKYDWCSYDGVVHDDHSLPSLQKPYAVMREALDGTDRDILFSLCQYGWGDVWEWGAEPAVGGNVWRTTGDIQDNWGSMHAIYEGQAGHEQYAGPGHWNDPDMLMVGIVGFGNTHPTHLRPNEQILHFSMWCLLSAPLLIGCDMTRLDPFTQALLSNDEALDIDQDPLGKPARLVHRELEVGEVWARPLFDGTHAVGLVNPNPWASTITVHWADLGLQGPQPVRDLWLHQGVGVTMHQYSAQVPAHGCVLLKVGRPVSSLSTVSDSPQVSPLTVGTLSASVTKGGVLLTLSEGVSEGSGAGYGYRLYRGTQPHFTPDGTSLIAAPTSLPFLDPHRPAPFTVSYYKLVAHDGTGATINVFPAGTDATPVSSITTPLATPASFQAADATPTPQTHTANVLCIVNIGDSITAGATISPESAPPVTLAADLAARTGASIFFSNRGVSGTTTADWQPSGSLFLGAESAANALNAAHPGTQMIFSIMLGTNDSATAGPNGSPISGTIYGQNIQNIIGRLLADYPGGKIFLHRPLWYSPNTHNGSDYQESGLARMVGYFPVIDALILSYRATNPGHVYAGDKKAYEYFAQHYLTELTPESGAAGYGTFYLHPNTQGAADLGRFQSEAIANRLLR